jgi:folate-binding protein YgfZ
MTPANDAVNRPLMLKEYAAARTGAALFDRSAAARIELAGPDAATFLHNLCTQDVKNLAEGGGCETFLTTAKARVVAHGAVSRVTWHGQSVYWFDTEPGEAERVLQHLNHFLISEQVELADRTALLGLLRVVGPSAAAIVAKACGATLPNLEPWRHVTLACDGAAVVVRYHNILNLSGYDCFCEAAQTPRLKERLIAAGALPAGVEAYELLRVESGWPVVGIDMDENRFVVEVGRGAQAICYTKGCYLGQEPIVMARDRGQVNRMLLGLLCGAGPALAAGSKLFQGDAEVGQVTSSVESPRLGQAIALAYIRRGSQEPGTKLTIEPVAAGRQGVVRTLPFA